MAEGDAGTTAGGDAGTAVAPAQTTPQSVSWMDGVPEDLRPRIEKFTNAPNPVAALAKSYAEVESQASRLNSQMDRMVLIPDPEKAKAEDIKLYREKMGIPESIDGYGVEMPEAEDAQARMTGVLELMHKQGISKTQAEALLDHYDNMLSTLAEEQAEQFKADAERQAEALKKEWGDKFDVNVKLAERQFKTLYGENSGIDKIKLEDGSLLGNHPAFVKALSAAGAANAELTGGTMLSGDGGGGSQPAVTMEDYRARLADPKYHSMYERDPQFVKETEEMAQRLFGGPNNVLIGPTSSGGRAR
jgi:hypothetical protein